MRGNVDTRLRMVSSGRLDAVVLARAGLLRIGRADEATEVLDPIQVLPAPGQGALAVECRADDAATLAALAVLDDPATRACVVAERTLLATLEGGCSAPVGALADYVEADPDGGTGAELYLRAVALAADGSLDLRRSATGPADDAEELGRAARAGAARGRRRRPGAGRARPRRPAVPTPEPGAPPDAPPGARPGPPDARPDAPPDAAPAAGGDASGQEQTFARIGSAAQESEQ